MGYGLGVEFTKKILFYDYFIPTSYVHLGYLATWYKFGIFGLLLNLYIWIYTLIKSAQLYKITKKPDIQDIITYDRRIYGGNRASKYHQPSNTHV